MQYILALDQGTTSSRAIILTKEGHIVGIAQKELQQIFPNPGWVEHNACEIWSSQASVMTGALAMAHLKMRDIAAIGITNQRETTIVWDRKTSHPIHNAIVWQDRRTRTFCQSLKQEGYEPLFQKKTGLLLDPYFSGTKLRWILDNVPNAREKAERGELAFGTVDSWLLWQLTDGRYHITDATNASRTLLYNIHTHEWDNELLEILKIPRSLLPQVRDSSEVYAECSSTVCSSSTPIAGIAGDQQAALFGHSCFKKGMGKATYGTGCFILMNTGPKPAPVKNHLLTTIAYKIGNKTHYALEGSVFIGGAVVQWLRDNLGIIKHSRDIETLAKQSMNSNGVTFVPAFTGLGAPYWDPNTRGTIFGLTRGTQNSHIAYAALESIAFQVADVLDLMHELTPITQLRVDGGAVENNLLMQIQADYSNIPLVRPKWKEMTALGACFLAGLAVGFWKDLDEIQKLWKKEHEFFPSINDVKRKEAKNKWDKAVHWAKMWGNS